MIKKYRIWLLIAILFLACMPFVYTKNGTTQIELFTASLVIASCFMAFNGLIKDIKGESCQKKKN